jgi:hypothetical protein
MFFRHPKLSGYYFDYVYIMSNDFQINEIFNPMQVIKDNLLTIKRRIFKKLESYGIIGKNNAWSYKKS